MGSRGRVFSLEGIVRLSLVAAIIAGVLLAWREGWINLPRNALPWQTPDLAKPPGWFAHLQIDRLAADPEACRAVLAKAGVGYTRIPDGRTGPGCGYTDAVFQTAIKRVSDAMHTADAARGGAVTLIAQEYSTMSPFNMDNTRLLLQHFSYFALYDGAGNNRPVLIGNVPDEKSFTGLCKSAAGKSHNDRSDGYKSKSGHNKTLLNLMGGRDYGD